MTEFSPPGVALTKFAVDRAVRWRDMRVLYAPLLSLVESALVHHPQVRRLCTDHV